MHPQTIDALFITWLMVSGGGAFVRNINKGTRCLQTSQRFQESSTQLWISWRHPASRPGMNKTQKRHSGGYWNNWLPEDAKE